ncbi:MAG: hypothetical protein FWF67_07595 [Fibromonadales bacterium]|nr:hypothetical protein [Fibromonadales bacterium]
MNKTLPFLLLAFFMCFGQQAKNADVDSLKKAISDLTEKQNEIKKSTDSIIIKASEKSHELYNTSFKDIQNSFSNFLIAVSVISGVLAVFIGILVLVNFKSAENSKKEVKEELAKIKNFENQILDLETKLNEIKSQKNEFENDFKEQIEKQKNEVEKYKNEVEEFKKWREGNTFLIAE